MKIRIYITLLAFVICQMSFAQGFKVKEFKQNLNDGSAFHAPLDSEEHPCGLIKVRSDISDLQFKGEIIGDVENKMNEYWVYVPQSSQNLKINHPNFIPFVVSFADYGIDISSKATYILTLEETKYKKEKTGVTIIVKPENADLYIDDVFIDNLSTNGFYQLYLPKGEHVCKFMKTGYRPNVQIVQTGKGSQNLNVELESVMAELEVECKTGTAEIFVDGERKGNGTWKGAIFPGEHKVEARLQNYKSNTQIISVAEKENKNIIIPELKRSVGKLEIVTNPNRIPVIIDGKDVGASPCSLDVETGNHYVVCKAFGLVPTRSEIVVNSDHVANLRIDLQYSTDRDWLKETYKKAYQGDNNAISELADTYVGWGYRENEEFYEEAIYWYERYSQAEKLLNSSEAWIEAFCYVGKPEKALEIYPTISKYNLENGGMGLSDDLLMDKIGNAFLKKKNYDNAFSCFIKAMEADKYDYGCGLEGLGDCYKAKGNKQKAAVYYQKYLTKSDLYGRRKLVEKKLNDL